MSLRKCGVWAGFGCLSLSCSLLVVGEEPMRCSQEGQVGPPACDAGLVCREGLCQAETAPPIEPSDGAAGAGGQGGGKP